MSKYQKTNITPSDKAWLAARAATNHRKMIEEISAIREILTAYELGNIRLPLIDFTGQGDEIGKAGEK